MFKAFTFKSLALLAVMAAVATVSAAGPASAKKKPLVPGHWERSEDGGFEWVGKKPKKLMGGAPVVRDHRNGSQAGGGVVVTSTPEVRDHRAKPIVNDHRKKKKIFGMPAWN
jgi:hypothetical protein